MSPSSKGKRSIGKDSKSKSPKGSKKAESPVKKSPTPKLKSRSKATTPVQAVSQTPISTARLDDGQPEPPKPGSSEWVYVDEAISEKISKILCDHWDVTETFYINNSKHVFRKIRAEREQIFRYFFNIKTNFKEYLKRPDTKQVYIDSFIKDYNNIPDDMREDEEVKAELHQRVEDLNDTLWNICDTKKIESEKERETFMNNGWLQDKTGLLTNHYITLMQTELDRFQDTARLLKDYYKCMTNPMPDELGSDYPRLPLIDVILFSFRCDIFFK